MSTVAEIKAAIGTLAPAERAELERWLRRPGTAGDDGTIPVRDAASNPEEDSPELEAELLKSAQGPFASFSPEDLREACEQVAREKRRR